MNAKKIKNKTTTEINSDLKMALPVAAKPSSVWLRLKSAVTAPDMTLEEWERIETKRTPSSHSSNQWRNF
ncbi:MAG: hypothetical protein J0M15_09985 [Deltaproteobacteria bacterium]|jgi:hypothetical protein|nr:hypothetical protein [Deltaproteobacteria bacterium]